jgi:hypothetical protein
MPHTASIPTSSSDKRKINADDQAAMQINRPDALKKMLLGPT